MKNKPNNFQLVLDALNGPAKFPAALVEQLTDLPMSDQQALAKAWPQVSEKKKNALLKTLNAALDDDDMLCFEEVAQIMLEDPSEMVRVQAVRLLKYTENTHMLAPLLRLAQNDTSPEVRAAAAGTLGNFINLAQVEHIPADYGKKAEKALLTASDDADGSVQRAALESLGYSSNKLITPLIRAALERHDPRWVASALTAISRTADNEWQDEVLTHLHSEEAEIRRAAVLAAGELGLATARTHLFDILEDEEEEDETLAAAIWALSLIGGDDVREFLTTLLDNSEDDNLIEFIEEALLNLDLTEDMASFNLLALNPSEEEDLKPRKRP